jgi:hypothetical protein
MSGERAQRSTQLRRLDRLVEKRRVEALRGNHQQHPL